VITARLQVTGGLWKSTIAACQKKGRGRNDNHTANSSNSVSQNNSLKTAADNVQKAIGGTLPAELYHVFLLFLSLTLR
jgi:hypothetical protein